MSRFYQLSKFAEDYRGLNQNRMSRVEVCRGLPKIVMSELTILCKPEARTGNMLIMTVINLHFIKTCKNLLSSDVNKFYYSLLCMHIILKLLKRNQGVYCLMTLGTDESAFWTGSMTDLSEKNRFSEMNRTLHHYLIYLINCSGRSYDQLMLQSRRGLPELRLSSIRRSN